MGNRRDNMYVYFYFILFILSDRGRPIFFVASRGHHADIGGLTPGSMPPHSVSLAQEGAAFKSFLLVDGGRFNEKELTEGRACVSTSGAI